MGFAPASEASHAASTTAAQAVRVVAIDVRASKHVHFAATRLISALFASEAELGGGRDAAVLLAVGGAPRDPDAVELMSTLMPGSLADPRFEKTCIGRLSQAASDASHRGATPDKARKGNQGDRQGVEMTQLFLERTVSYFDGRRFGAARIHLYLAAVPDMETVSAVVASGVCHSSQTLEPGRDAWSLFGEVFACLLSSRITLKVGQNIMQMLARPRIRGVGCLPPVLSLTAVRRVAIETVPEDVLFGIPTALIPDNDTAEDATSASDSKMFSELAEALFTKGEALIVAERAGPHIILLPASPHVLLLREVACRETLLPPPPKTTPGLSASSEPLPDHVFGVADSVPVSSFNPYELEGTALSKAAEPRVVAFRTEPSGY